MTISAAQLRAARELLGCSQDDVAGASGLEITTIANFELGKRSPDREALGEIRITLEAAGIEFVESVGSTGVKLRQTK
jgi:transcriptional regulator with XRE-family HTH domain